MTFYDVTSFMDNPKVNIQQHNYFNINPIFLQMKQIFWNPKLFPMQKLCGLLKKKLPTRNN